MRDRTLVGACFGVLLSLAHSASGQDVAMFRGGPAHLGVYAGNPIVHAPRIKWTFHTDGRVYGSAAIANKLAYVGSTDGFLYALDVTTGVQKWKFHTGARVTSSPAVAMGSVYFESYDGTFYALDALNGSLRWKFAVAGERRFAGAHIHGTEPAAETMPDPFDFFLSSPAVRDGTVYFGSGDGNIYALDSQTGALRWKFATGNVVHASPAIADGTLFVGSWDTYFYALDAKSGALKWRFKTGEDHAIHNQEGIQGSAAVAGGLVYFGCRDSNLYALNERTGKQVWSLNNKGSWVIASPAISEGKLYVSSSDGGMFYALDASTGAIRFSLDYKHWPMFSSPAVVGRFAYFGSHQGKVFAVDLQSGHEAWTFQTEASHDLLARYSKPDGTPNYGAVVTGNFYDDMMVGVSKLMDVGAIIASPVPADGLIIVGSADGNVYALQ